ncbi:mandelate racemase/muconate lactonizing enzyme family protein [Ancylobacter pratisalsi]|uniref:Mandelate racemase/muconate lactonizing enzyme family protein n=1 Tax=Ancylobacter pratisalsi TaxID=1745854 RepID=A0A6P1YK69_9HYPH|nr:mandelate racemase/muconate lactonizing enzyme family protein [Ancylobacter pratisalsi]QIB33081.1 mandelate racemase/muconate lactonizing enzyme family protein [Ancylobacter pratisalsi]
MKIETVDFFYLAMPEITTAADGSQDALVVRVAAGGHVGWGECEAAPLPSIAAFVCPMSHGACQPVRNSVLGQRLDGQQDIIRIAAQIEYDSMDLLQATHTWSGIEMALWDLLGKARGEPVWKLLGYDRSCRKTPYASQLFGDTPQETLERGRRSRADGFRAVKFGWGPIGRGALNVDVDHLVAAREGLGADGILLVDVGQIFGEDVERASERLPALEAARATWLEEPFAASAYSEYAALAARSTVKMAGGEGAHNFHMARNLIDFGGIGYVQIDCGRIGGIGPAKRVADHARAKGVTYVNHTFTSNLALSASLQPYAGVAEATLCEFPVALQPLAVELTANHIERDGNGEITAPEAPGLGVEIDQAALDRYRVDIEISVGGRTLFSSRAGGDPGKAGMTAMDVAS